MDRPLGFQFALWGCFLAFLAGCASSPNRIAEDSDTKDYLVTAPVQYKTPDGGPLFSQEEYDNEFKRLSGELANIESSILQAGTEAELTNVARSLRLALSEMKPSVLSFYRLSPGNQGAEVLLRFDSITAGVDKLAEVAAEALKQSIAQVELEEKRRAKKKAESDFNAVIDKLRGGEKVLTEQEWRLVLTGQKMETVISIMGTPDFTMKRDAEWYYKRRVPDFLSRKL
jgi:hypothetical protein